MFDMNSFISWIGGKKLLRDEIIARFPEKYNRYIEVFGGAAWVLFRKDRHAPMEIYNDANSDLVNLFRVAKFHADELARQLDLMLMSREMFYDVRDTSCVTDIQRAARFWYLLQSSFGSDGRSFACRPKDLQRAAARLPDVQKRLSRVLIEHKDFAALIRQYDRPDALFYCDPPYYGTEDYYTAEFTVADHVRLRDCLAGIKGKFVLSYNDCPEVRELYQGYQIDTVERVHNLKPGERYRELIIRNFE